MGGKEEQGNLNEKFNNTSLKTPLPQTGLTSAYLPKSTRKRPSPTLNDVLNS